MKPAEAEVLAVRILAAIDNAYCPNGLVRAHQNRDKERVASDLAGLRRHRENGYDDCGICRTSIGNVEWPCEDARRYAEGLRRTAAVYWVTA